MEVACLGPQTVGTASLLAVSNILPLSTGATFNHPCEFIVLKLALSRAYSGLHYVVQPKN